MVSKHSKTLNISVQALEDFRQVCEHKGITIGEYMARVVEGHHESSEFGALLSRALLAADRNQKKEIGEQE